MEVFLDVTTNNLPELHEIVLQTKNMVAIKGYKVSGLALTAGLRAPVSIVKELTDKIMIYDHQGFGTETTAEGLVENIRAISLAKPHAVILFPATGTETIKVYAKTCRGFGITLIVALSTYAPDLFSIRGGFMGMPAANGMLASALRFGVKDFLLDANHPKVIERVSKILESALSDKFTDSTRFYIQNLTPENKVAQEFLHKLNCCLILPIRAKQGKLVPVEINSIVAKFKEQGWQV